MAQDPDEPDVTDYLRDHAPDLDEREVIGFMAQHDKPENEKGFLVEWAVRSLRQRRENDDRDGPSINHVVDAMRRHDAQ